MLRRTAWTTKVGVNIKTGLHKDDENKIEFYCNIADLYIQKELLEKDPNLNEITFPEYEILIEPEERDEDDDLEFDQQSKQHSI